MTVQHRCKIDGCRGTGAGNLCPAHQAMQATIRAAQRGPVAQMDVDAFLAALESGHGEGENTPGRHLARKDAAIPKQTRKRAS